MRGSLFIVAGAVAILAGSAAFGGVRPDGRRVGAGMSCADVTAVRISGEVTNPGTAGPETTRPAGVRSGQADSPGLSKGEKQAIEAATAKNGELKNVYAQKSKDMKDEELKKIKDEKGAEWAAANDSIKKIQSQMDDAGIALEKARANGARDEIRNRLIDLGHLQDELETATKNRDTLAGTIKAAQAAAVRGMNDRNAKITLVFQRNVRVIGLGGVPTEVQMRAEFDEAMGVKGK